MRLTQFHFNLGRERGIWIFFAHFWELRDLSFRASVIHPRPCHHARESVFDYGILSSSHRKFWKIDSSSVAIIKAKSKILFVQSLRCPDELSFLNISVLTCHFWHSDWPTAETSWNAYSDETIWFILVLFLLIVTWQCNITFELLVNF